IFQAGKRPGALLPDCEHRGYCAATAHQPLPAGYSFGLLGLASFGTIQTSRQEGGVRSSIVLRESKPVAQKPVRSPAQPLDASLVRIESLTRQIIERGHFDLSVSVHRLPSSAPGELVFETPEAIVEFSGSDSDLLLERNAELMNALEHVVLKAV